MSWTKIAYELGYYDQMHMIESFKEFTGFTPSAMIKDSESTIQFQKTVYKKITKLKRKILAVPIFFVSLIIGCAVGKAQIQKPSVTWQWELAHIIRHPPAGVEISGNPKVINTPHGEAVQFNGQEDGIFYNQNPVAGWKQYTIEMIFRPAANGPFAQRIINLGTSRGSRILIEIRNTGPYWYLDAFLSSKSKLTLIDSSKLHPTAQWYNVAFMIDRGKLKTFVNRKHELSGKVSFTPLPEGASSFGTRLNRKYWFKGAIREIRMSRKIVDTACFLKP